MTDDKRNINQQLACYGTLRYGHGNHNWFLRDVLMCSAGSMITGYTMSTFGGYPAVFSTGNEEDVIIVDVFDLSTAPEPESLLRSIDAMEIGAGYRRDVVTTTSGLEVYLYVMLDEDKEYFPEEIPSGDWNDYCDRRTG